MVWPLSWLFDTSGFVPRWQCGDWAGGLGWLHVAADLAIWLAYLTIPVLLAAFVRRRRDLPFPRMFWLFALFILTCGTTHLLDAVVYYQPVYRLSGAVKLATAVASWATIAALVPVLRQALALRTPQELEREVAARTADLAAANAALRTEADERARAERALTEQREWFRVVLASIGDGIVATDPEHRVAFLNPAAEALTGWPAAEAVGQPLDAVVRTLDEETRGRAESPVSRVLREGREVGLANHALLVDRSGRERVIERSAAPIRGGEGGVLGVVMALRDSTARRRAEADRARLAAIVEGSEDAIIGESAAGTILAWNPAAERLYGWTAAEAVGQPITLLVPPEQRAELAAVMSRVARGERVPSFETVRVTKDGRRVDVSVTLSPIRGPDGAVVGYSKIIRDVTDARRAAAATRDALERLRGVMNQAVEGIITIDERGTVETVNPAVERLFGYAPDEVVGRNVAMLMPDPYRSEHDSYLANYLRTGRARIIGIGREVVGRRKDGTEFPAELSVSEVRLSGGRVFTGIVRDVSERRRAEAALRASEARFRQLADAVPQIVWAAGPDGRTAFLNRRWGEYTGLDPADTEDSARVIHPDDRAAASAAWQQAQADRVPYRVEARMRAADGTYRWFLVRCVPVLGADGAVREWFGTSTDIDDLKRAEAAAQRGLARLRAVIDTMRDGLVLCDPAGNLLELNPAALRMHEFGSVEETRRHLSSFTTMFELSPPGGSPLPLSEWPISRVLRGEDVADCEIHVLRTDIGKEIVISYSGSMVYGPDGRPDLVVLTLHDATARRRVEDALRVSEARFRQLADAMPQIVWTARPDGHVDYYNRRGLELTGVADGATGDGSWLPVLHPDDRQRTLDRWAESVRAGTPHELEFRLLAAGSGEYRWHLVRALPARDDAGRVVRWYGTATDIHDRKRTEEELSREREFLRAVLDNLAEGVLACDPTGHLTLANRAARDIHGSGDDPLPAEGWADRFPRFLPDGTRLGYDQLPLIRALRGERVFDVEFLIARPDGDRRTVVGRGESLADATGARIGAVLAILDVTEQRQAEAELRLRDRAIQAASQGLLITDPTAADDPIVYASPGFEKLTGYPAAEVVGRNCRFLQGPATDPTAVAALREAVAAGRECSVELVNYRKDGTAFWNALAITPVRDGGDRVTHFVGVLTDVTGRRKLEEQFRQAQKMEAVGQLAGGVAHDFNNLLTVINGYSELLLDGLPDDAPDRPALAAIRDAGDRATGLTGQLLAFSRQAVLEPKVLDPNRLVQDTGKMLHRLIGEDVTLSLALATPVSRVRVDPGQFGQVLMNLAVNARDAMPTGGRLTIETRDVDLDPGYASLVPGVRAGRYVLTAVTDTGVGIPPELRAKVFEPFFTTKAPGRGTGLGLATVYGIVKQSGGHVDVYSEVGTGTTVKVYLPAVDAPAAQAADPGRAGVRGGTETVLLVEDQAEVRTLARRALEAQGYTVLDAADGMAAVRLIEQDRPPIQLLVTDVVLPGMSGRQVAEAVRAAYPEVPVLFVSGYTDDAVVRHGILQAEVAFLRKPYTPLSLARKVREVLDHPPDPGAADRPG